MKAIKLENLTWIEAEKHFNEDLVFVIPLGSRLKEHGPHLPLNNDWVLAEYLSEQLAQELRFVLLPTLQFGYFPAFVNYPGSIHIELLTFQNYLDDIVTSLSRHGVKKIYFLNTGISTLTPLNGLKDKWQNSLKIEFTDFLKLDSLLPENLQEQDGGTHADELETSLMLTIDESIVKMDLAKKDFNKRVAPGPLTRKEGSCEGIYSPTGSWGDPTLATKEKGQKILSLYLKEISRTLCSM